MRGLVGTVGEEGGCEGGRVRWGGAGEGSEGECACPISSSTRERPSISPLAVTLGGWEGGEGGRGREREGRRREGREGGRGDGEGEREGRREGGDGGQEKRKF